MKKQLILPLLLLLGIIGYNFSVHAQSNHPIKIGLIVDGDGSQKEMEDQFRAFLQKEIGAVLGSGYQVDVPAYLIQHTKGSHILFQEGYAALNNSEADIIIVAGLFSSAFVLEEKEHKKPTFAIGVVDQQIQDIHLTKENNSGKHNLNYLITPLTMTNDIEAFKRVYPFKFLAIVLDKGFVDFSFRNKGKEIREKVLKGDKYEVIQSNTTAEDVLKLLPENADAVYLGFTSFQFTGTERAKLIDELVKRKIPIYGNEYEDIARGALVTNTPKNLYPKLLRKLALNIEKYVSGTPVKDIDVHIDLDHQLTINNSSASRIGFSPSFTLFGEASFVGESITSTENDESVYSIINEALEQNLGLKAEQVDVAILEQDRKLAVSNYLPSFDLEGQYVQQSTRSAIFQPEKSTDATLAFNQVLYSEQVVAGIKIQNYLKEAEIQGAKKEALDVINNTASSVANVLISRNTKDIQRKLLGSIKRNLEIAKLKQQIGYAGISDVYRWQNELASATQNVIEAENTETSNKLQLTFLLNRTVGDSVYPQDFDLENQVFDLLQKASIDKYVHNQTDLKQIIDFLVDEAITNIPDVKELEANIKAVKREKIMNNRVRYLPTVGLGVNYKSNLGFTKGDNPQAINPLNNSWNLGVSAKIPVFQGFSQNRKIEKNKLQLEKLAYQEENLKQSLRLNIRDAFLTYINAWTSLELTQVAADNGKKNLELIRDSYSKGQSNIITLIDAQNSAFSSELQAKNAKYIYFISILGIYRNIGWFGMIAPEAEQAQFIERLTQQLIKE